MQVMEYLNCHRQDEDPCECVILPDGSIEEPKPSHVEKLVQLAGEEKAALNGKMDKNMEPLFFLVEYTGCLLVWPTRVVEPSKPTIAQENSLEMLYDSALLSPGFLRQKVEPKYTECVQRGKERTVNQNEK